MQLNGDGQKDPFVEIRSAHPTAPRIRSRWAGGGPELQVGEAEPRTPGIRPGKQDPKARKVQSEDAAEEKPKGMRGRAGKGLGCLQTAGAGD